MTPDRTTGIHDLPHRSCEASPAAVRQHHPEAGWLAVLAVLAGLELAWWAILWRAGLAPALHPAPYLGAAAVALAAAAALRAMMRLRPFGADWRTIACGALLIAAAASAFLPLKAAIPAQTSFWLDPHLAAAEARLFGEAPWRILDGLLGHSTALLDGLYGSWLPVQVVGLFLVILSPPSDRKSRALVAYGLAWFALGVVAAVGFASVGPIFYDRAFGQQTFAGLSETLRARGARIAIAESDLMWKSLESGRLGLVAGISAMPSLHVAISVWLALAARTLAPSLAPITLLYAAVIWIGSVQLGWHYVSDGLFGAMGMLAIWRGAAWIEASALSLFRPLEAPSA